MSRFVIRGSLYRSSLNWGSSYRSSLYRGSLYRGSLYRGSLYQGSLCVLCVFAAFMENCKFLLEWGGNEVFENLKCEDLPVYTVDGEEEECVGGEEAATPATAGKL